MFYNYKFSKRVVSFLTFFVDLQLARIYNYINRIIGRRVDMFKSISAREMRLLPLYVYGSQSLYNQAPMRREKGIMLHSQFSLCRSGEGVFTDYNNITHRVRRGDVMYFLSAVPNSYAPTSEPWGVDYIVCGGNALMSYAEALGLSKSGVINISDKRRDIVDELFEKIVTLNNLKGENTHAQCSRLLYELMAVLGYEIESGRGKSSVKKAELIAPCVDYIKSNYMEDISMAHLAEMIGITPTYLGILFREVYNITPQKLLVNIRIENAKRLLTVQKNAGLAEIASLSGFNSTSYLCNTFKRYMGMTPDEYRRANTYTDI